jgi:hypothetical protein
LEIIIYRRDMLLAQSKLEIEHARRVIEHIGRHLIRRGSENDIVKRPHDDRRISRIRHRERRPCPQLSAIRARTV